MNDWRLLPAIEQNKINYFVALSFLDQKKSLGIFFANSLSERHRKQATGSAPNQQTSW